MRMVRADALLSWSCLKEFRTLDASEYVDYSGDMGATPLHKFVFVSHRWISPQHPDPDGSQLVELQQRLHTLPILATEMAPLLVFFDYCSLPQRPWTPQEESEFYRDLGSLESLSRLADQFIILSEGYRDYVNRAWCFFEAITARGNVYFFSDQNAIREELEFREFFMVDELPQITGYDLNYKMKASETEIIVAVFQHLRTCRVTHPEDAPMIKDQLIAHYNKRRLSSFGKLLIGIHKYFLVEFGLISPPQLELYACRPFFEQPDWVRLPGRESHAPPSSELDKNFALLTMLMGERPGPSLFAIPRETWEEILRRPTRAIPVLQLSIPGVQDIKRYLERFQSNPDWGRYVVSPDMIGEGGDCFPAIDNVIHTVLERPPGFFCSKDGQHLYFFLQ